MVDNTENLLLDKQLKEAAQVKQFLDSPAWLWLKARLEGIRPALMMKATMAGTKRDDRMLVLGKLAFVEEILSRPGMLSELLVRHEATEQAQIIPPVQPVASQRYTPGRL